MDSVGRRVVWYAPPRAVDVGLALSRQAHNCDHRNGRRGGRPLGRGGANRWAPDRRLLAQPSNEGRDRAREHRSLLCDIDRDYLALLSPPLPPYPPLFPLGL